MIILGKVRPLSGHLAGPHPQVLIIARITQDENVSYFLLAGYSDGGNTKPTTAKSSDKLYKWTWDNLKDLVDGAR